MLNTEDLRWPAATEPRYVEWSSVRSDNGEGYSCAETFTFEHEDESYTLIDSDGAVVGAVVDGRAYTHEQVQERADDELDDETAATTWTLLLTALEAAERDDSFGAEGPMMNYFWHLGDSGDIDEMAAKLDGLPLCVVEFEESGEIGLALTGGGMDLSWEIAEGFIRLGYRPPTSLDLPGMVGRGESEDDQAIVRAVVETKRATAANLLYGADRLAEQYGIRVSTS